MTSRKRTSSYPTQRYHIVARDPTSVHGWRCEHVVDLVERQVAAILARLRTPKPCHIRFHRRCARGSRDALAKARKRAALTGACPVFKGRVAAAPVPGRSQGACEGQRKCLLAGSRLAR